MCLYDLDKKPFTRRKVGYKSVLKNEDGTYECYDHIGSAGSVRYPLRQWITDPKTGLSDGGYPTGFHISLDKEKVRFPGYVVIKVKFRGVVASQTTKVSYTYGRQVVAREIMNLGEV